MKMTIKLNEIKHIKSFSNMLGVNTEITNKRALRALVRSSGFHWPSSSAK